MAKCAVTGGAGFIGSHLVRGLLGRGHRVVIIDNFSTGKMENLDGVAQGPVAQLLNLDIREAGSLERVFEGCRWVFHEAAIPSVQRSLDNPDETNSVNITGTLNVLQAARRAGVEKLLFAASSSAYGESEVLPKHEGMTPQPLSPYALQKYVGELYCRVFSQLYGLKTIALRYFNVFGPRQDPKSEYAAVIPRFVTRMLSGQSPIIYGDGEQTRDFTYIDNVIDANVRAAESSADGIVVNIASGRRFSLNQTVELLNSILGCSLRSIYEPARKGDVRHSLADIQAARQFINYAPSVDFRQGLQQTVDWYRHQLAHQQ